MAAQPQPPRPVQEADAAPDNIEPAALPAAQVPPELRKKFYKTENGSLPLLTQFLNQRPAEDPVSLTRFICIADWRRPALWPTQVSLSYMSQR
jgi:hypothetical protein